jgi:hypothetical protein
LQIHILFPGNRAFTQNLYGFNQTPDRCLWLFEWPSMWNDASNLRSAFLRKSFSTFLFEIAFWYAALVRKSLCLTSRVSWVLSVQATHFVYTLLQTFTFLHSVYTINSRLLNPVLKSVFFLVFFVVWLRVPNIQYQVGSALWGTLPPVPRKRSQTLQHTWTRQRLWSLGKPAEWMPLHQLH